MSGDLPNLPGNCAYLGQLPNATVSLWKGRPPGGTSLCKSLLAYMPTSPGDRHCAVIFTKNDRLDEATHLMESGLVFVVRFEGVIREKRRTLAVFLMVRPESAAKEEEVGPLAAPPRP